MGSICGRAVCNFFFSVDTAVAFPAFYSHFGFLVDLFASFIHESFGPSARVYRVPFNMEAFAITEWERGFNTASTGFMTTTTGFNKRKEYS